MQHAQTAQAPTSPDGTVSPRDGEIQAGQKAAPQRGKFEGGGSVTAARGGVRDGHSTLVGAVRGERDGEAPIAGRAKRRRSIQEEELVDLPSLRGRIHSFRQAMEDAANPAKMAAKISEHSDRKKYNFAEGLKRDLEHTRAALRACARADNTTSFREVFAYTEGQIANLNKVLQNLRSAGEVAYEAEIFWSGQNDKERIALLPAFWRGAYTVDAENVFRPGRTVRDVAEEDRLGRSYVVENLATMDVKVCATCEQEVAPADRMVVRGRVLHVRCVECAVCGAHPRDRTDYVTFDGHVCCSAACIKAYDAAHTRQARN